MILLLLCMLVGGNIVIKIVTINYRLLLLRNPINWFVGTYQVQRDETKTFKKKIHKTESNEKILSRKLNKPEQ